MWDSAFARFWRILRGGLAHYRLDKSLRPPLESHQNHRKILESCAICLKAQILPPTYFCIKHILTLLAQLLEFFAIYLKAPESMDCHAHKSARNDRKTAQNPQSHNSTNAARRQDFAMILGVVERKARAHTRAYVTAALRDDSLKSAQKPTPKLSQIHQPQTKQRKEHQ